MTLEDPEGIRALFDEGQAIATDAAIVIQNGLRSFHFAKAKPPHLPQPSSRHPEWDAPILNEKGEVKCGRCSSYHPIEEMRDPKRPWRISVTRPGGCRKEAK